MNISYIRVSSIDQNEERQIVAIEKHNIEKWFIEKASAKDTNRPQLKEMMNFIESFYKFNSKLDKEHQQALTVYIHDFSRLARSTKDLLSITEELKAKDVKLVSLKESLDTSTATGKLMLTMIAAINEFERDNLLERQREGIAIAKSKGKYKGRKKIQRPKNWEDVYNKWKIREITATKAMDLLNLKRNTFYKLVKEWEEENSFTIELDIKGNKYIQYKM